MVIGSLVLHLRLPEVHSLKEKRSIVKSIVARLRNDFNVSAAEVAEQERWQLAVIGVACVSGNGDHARKHLDAVVDWVYTNRPDVDVTDTELEVF